MFEILVLWFISSDHVIHPVSSDAIGCHKQFLSSYLVAWPVHLSGNLVELEPTGRLWETSLLKLTLFWRIVFLHLSCMRQQKALKQKKNNLNLWPLAQPAFIKCIQQIFIVYTTLPFIHFWEDTGSCTVPRYSAKNTCALKTSCFCIYLAPMWIHYLSSYSKLQFTYFLKKCNIKAMKNCTYCGWRG